MAMNVGEAITPAIAHTSRLLFKPFVLRKWLALGLVLLLAEMGGGNFRVPGDESSAYEDAGQSAAVWIAEHLALLVLAGVVLFALSLVLLWLSAIFKFVYVNQVTRVPLAIREPFHQFVGLGTSFFLWQLAFALVAIILLAIAALPPIVAFVTNANLAVKVITVIWAVIVGLATILSAALADIFSRDFVLTTMFVRNVRVLEAWDTVIPILKANAGQIVPYLLMLMVISIASSIGAVICVLAVGLVFLIPGGLLALIGWGIYSASGQQWSAALIGYSIVAGLPLLLAFVYAATCALQPLYVFRKSYALVILGQAEPSLATIPVPPAGAPGLAPQNGA